VAETRFTYCQAPGIIALWMTAAEGIDREDRAKELTVIKLMRDLHFFLKEE
jgi:hypothetical protein